MSHTAEIQKVSNQSARTSRRTDGTHTREHGPAEGSRLTGHLKELLCSAWQIGHRAVLYCADCEAAIPYKYAVEGVKPNWPYCPFHRDKPLMIHTSSLTPPEVG